MIGDNLTTIIETEGTYFFKDPVLTLPFCDVTEIIIITARLQQEPVFVTVGADIFNVGVCSVPEPQGEPFIMEREVHDGHVITINEIYRINRV